MLFSALPGRGAEPLGELDDQPLGAAHVDEPPARPVVLDVADETEALLPQPLDGAVDVVDLDRDVPVAEPVRRQGLRSFAGLRRSTSSPSTDIRPSLSKPSAAKKPSAASRSSTMTPT